jgi:lipoprotein-anchoring transpeptidase ErfK/SrfK
VPSAGAQGYTAAVRKIAIAVGIASLALAGVLAASVLAGSGPLGALTESTSSTTTTETTSTTTTTETTETTETTPTPPPKPKPKPRPKKPTRLARGVTVGGVHVGRLTASAALAAVRLSVRSPLVVSVEDERVEVSPNRLGAKAYIEPAVSRALRSAPGTHVPVVVTVKGSAVRSWVAGLAHKHDRELRDAHVVLLNLKPKLVAERDGYGIRREATVARVVDALHANRRGPVEAVARIEHPKVQSTSFTSVIVIRRGSNRLMYYKGEKLARTFTVATGQAAYPTPLGNFEIIAMWRNPWWYPPPSPWAQGAKPIPPGPGNPLGTRWMGLSAPAVGIHGTPDAASLGYSASHGCIRMAIPSAEWLFGHVQVGTPVFIVSA